MLNGPLKRDERLHGRYLIVHARHLSGVSALYEALDEQPWVESRSCAIKEVVVDDAAPRRAQAIEEFLRRARLLTTLTHPAIPPILDYFVIENRAYLVMPLLEGQDLEDMLYNSDSPLPVPTVVRWGLELCDVLSYLHSRQPDPIIYRDLKPANIVIDSQGRVRLVDFGAVELLSNAPNAAPLGTDGYAAPEQYEGVIAPSIDIYALGATLHQLLTRCDPRLEPPFSFAERPIRQYNPAVPKELEEVVMRALEYDPARRFGSVSDMARSLAQVEIV